MVVPFQNSRKFSLDTNEYRVAVEYLVQNAVLKQLRERERNLCVVSRVHANAYCSQASVREEAGIITRAVMGWLECSQITELDWRFGNA